MRMRHKKRLDERVSNANHYFLDNFCDQNALIAAQNPVYADFERIFGNKNPIVLEVGCGKGGFALKYAAANPAVNVVAVERLTNVVISGAEEAARQNLNNLKFIVTNAEYLPCFIKPHTVVKIILNFSCPYPKKSYRNRRLTNEKFLKIYKELLTDDGELWQKTDNIDFFEYGLECFANEGWRITAKTYDLYAAAHDFNIPTEYETKFVALGKPICFLIAKPPL